MHARSAARLAGAAIALGLLAAAAPAYAQDELVTIVPSVVEPGGSVEVNTDACGLDNFAVASSSVFESSIDLEPVDEDFRLVGVGKIDREAKSGRHRVTIECAEGATVSSHLRVAPRGGPDTGAGGLATSDRLAAAPPVREGGGLPTGQGVALLAMLGAGALVGLTVAVRAARRP